MTDERHEIRREALLEAGPGEVWEALTDERLLGEWLAEEAELEPVEGGRARFRLTDGEERHGRVLRVEEERSLAFAWSAPGGPESEVEFTLEPAISGTRLVVVERALVAGPTALAGVPWGARLDALATALALVAA